VEGTENAVGISLWWGLCGLVCVDMLKMIECGTLMGRWCFDKFLSASGIWELKKNGVEGWRKKENKINLGIFCVRVSISGNQFGKFIFFPQFSFNFNNNLLFNFLIIVI